jgi:hypothetical protein
MGDHRCVTSEQPILHRSANAAYGGWKIGTGLGLVAVGTAADVTGVGALIGVPAQAVGAYQIVTGGFRVYRGYGQLDGAWHEPTECKSPVHYGEDILLDVAPGGGTVTDFLGGLP